MKIIKKAGARFNGKLTGKVKNGFTAVCDCIDSRLQSRKKIAALNAWAENHPKLFFKYAIGVFILLFIAGAYNILCNNDGLNSESHPFESTLNEMHETSDLIDRMNRMHARGAHINRLTDELKYEVATIQHEIDSIAHRNPMSHQDTMEVAWRMHKLEVITNTLKSK